MYVELLHPQSLQNTLRRSLRFNCILHVICLCCIESFGPILISQSKAVSLFAWVLLQCHVKSHWHYPEGPHSPLTQYAVKQWQQIKQFVCSHHVKLRRVWITWQFKKYSRSNDSRYCCIWFNITTAFICLLRVPSVVKCSNLESQGILQKANSMNLVTSE